MIDRLRLGFTSGQRLLNHGQKSPWNYVAKLTKNSTTAKPKYENREEAESTGQCEIMKFFDSRLELEIETVIFHEVFGLTYVVFPKSRHR